MLLPSEVSYLIDQEPEHGEVIINESFSSPTPALSFDGSNDKVRVEGDNFISGNDPRTISVWATGNDGNIISLGDGQNPNKRFSILVAGNGNVLIIGQVNDWVTEYYLPQDELTHLVVTHDTTTVKLFANGEFKGQSQKIYDTDGSMPIIIGANTDNRSDEYFNGVIDEVAVRDLSLIHI